MNRLKRVAAFVAQALTVPCAFAQATDPVTLYGRVFVMFESVEATGGSAPIMAALQPLVEAAGLAWPKAQASAR